ncbi:MAG: hypothetical protein OD816_000963 [Thermodesulfobacterium sp.]|uniref:Uncharacterized protein n=1 Tax=Candidatus Thermodesulfobacterium syntrophicum TaxID=3060442 RepID=A0AAE3P5F7_9BACT|nr:hypothetical protein [Thermodesulfobacterium sp.]MDF2953718.1 hypothetical protein [Candidatus Thermodesulfobacterium syntrophicum]
MESLKKFIGKEIKVKTQKELEDLIKKYDFKYAYLPEDLEDFDELELVFDYTSSQDFHFTLTLFKKNIQRMMLVKIDKDNPEKIEPPTEEEIKIFLDKYGERITDFLEKL